MHFLKHFRRILCYARQNLYIGGQRDLDHYVNARKNIRKRAKKIFSFQAPSETKEENLNCA